MDLASLARLARSRFPGAYDHLDDETLGAAYAKKHNIPVDPPRKPTGVMAGIGNLLGGINETVNPAERLGDVLEGPAYALRHPIDSAKMMFDAAQAGSEDQFRKAMDSGVSLEGLGHATAGAIPFIGPASAQAGERIGQFGADNQEGMRGVGNALGLLLGGKAVEKGLGAGARVLRGSVTEIPPRAPVGSSLDPSALPGVPMMSHEVTGSGGMTKLAKALESSIPGSGPFDRFRATQQNALIDGLGATITGRMAQPGANLRPYDIGQVLQEALRNATADSRANAARVDNQFTRAIGNDPIDTSPIKEVAANRIEDIALTPNIPEKNTELAFLERQIDPNVKPSFTAVRRLKNEVYNKRTPLHGDYVEPMYTAAADSLNNAAQTRGMLPDFHNVNDTWSKHFKTFDEGLIPKMRDATPLEEVHKRIVGASLDDIRNIKDSVGPESFRDVKARILQDIMDEATSGELDTSPNFMRSARKGDIRGANDAVNANFRDTSKRRLSGKKFRGILENKDRFGEERLRAIFDNPKEYDAVMHFANTAEKVGASPSSLVGAFINANLLSNVMQAGYSGLYGDIAGVGSNLVDAAAMYGGVNLASRMITGELNPSKLMSRVLTKSGGAKAMSNYLEALSKKNANLPESIRFKVPDKSTKGKAYFWGRIVAKMAQDEADKMEQEQ